MELEAEKRGGDVRGCGPDVVEEGGEEVGCYPGGGEEGGEGEFGYGDSWGVLDRLGGELGKWERVTVVEYPHAVIERLNR